MKTKTYKMEDFEANKFFDSEMCSTGFDAQGLGLHLAKLFLKVKQTSDRDTDRRRLFKMFINVRGQPERKFTFSVDWYET